VYGSWGPSATAAVNRLMWQAGADKAADAEDEVAGNYALFAQLGSVGRIVARITRCIGQEALQDQLTRNVEERYMHPYDAKDRLFPVAFQKRTAAALADPESEVYRSTPCSLPFGALFPSIWLFALQSRLRKLAQYEKVRG